MRYDTLAVLAIAAIVTFFVLSLAARAMSLFRRRRRR